MTNQIYLVQSLPYENWETIAHFDNHADADALCNKKIEMANHNPLLVANYRVHVVADTIEHRIRYDIKDVVKVTLWKDNAPYNSEFLGAQPARVGQDY